MRAKKLSREDVLEIIDFHEQGYSYSAIAARYGVTPSAINYRLSQHVIVAAHRPKGERAAINARKRSKRGQALPRAERTTTANDGSVILVPESEATLCVVRMSDCLNMRYIVLTHGCPATRHPTRDCGCRVVQTLAEARAIAGVA